MTANFNDKKKTFIMQLHVAKDADSLSQELAEWITADIGKVLRTKDRYTLVLSGGSTPKNLYELLASPVYSDRINWKKIHIFFGDERYVPFEDERNNGKMAYDTLLHHVPVPEDQIHYMNTSVKPDQSAREYDKTLQQYFAGRSASFDLVLLGMGDDGHTLSLFPGTEVVHEKNVWVKAFYVAKLDMFRITLTAPIVNRAKAVIFLATGEKKAATLKAVIEGQYKPDTYPAQVIKPVDGELLWFTDQTASKLLDVK